MIIVPGERNKVGFAPKTDARFEAADYSGTGLQALGQGLEVLGQAGEHFAKVQQEVQDRFNDAGAKQIDNDAVAARQQILSDYQSKRGSEAEQAFPIAQAALVEVSRNAEAQAHTKTMREMVANVNGGRDVHAQADLLKHYQEQAQVAAVTSAEARRDRSAEAVIGATDPADRDANLATGEGEVRALGRLRGDPPEVVENDLRKYHSNVAFGIGRQLALSGDYDAALAHVDRYASRLRGADEAKLRDILAEPLRERAAEAHVDRRMGTATRTADAAFSYADPLHGNGRMPVADASGQGVAIPAPPNTPVFASRPGIARISQDGDGHVVTVDHGDGRATRYLALGQVSVGDGDSVTPDTAIGRVGDGGSGTPQLRYEIHDNGTPVGPDAVLADVRQSPRRLNLNAVLADIDRDPSLNPDMREDAKDAARRRAKLGNNLADREEEEARSRVYDVIYTLPDQRLTAISQIPPDLWADVPEDDRARLKAEMRDANLGNTPLPNGETLLELNRMAVEQPDEFAKADLRKFRNAMMRPEFDALATLQSQMRTNPTSPAVIARRRIWNQVALKMGSDPEGSGDPALRQGTQTLFAATCADLLPQIGHDEIPADNLIRASVNRQILNFQSREAETSANAILNKPGADTNPPLTMANGADRQSEDPTANDGSTDIVVTGDRGRAETDDAYESRMTRQETQAARERSVAAASMRSVRPVRLVSPRTAQEGRVLRDAFIAETKKHPRPEWAVSDAETVANYNRWIDVHAAAERAEDRGGEELGTLSASEESGGERGDPGRVSRGVGDAGGVSYGVHQFASNTGDAARFIASPEAQLWAADFENLTPGTPAFTAQWRAVASRDPDTFRHAQNAYSLRNHYTNMVERVQRSTGYNLDDASRAVREATYSTAIQHGGAATILSDVVRQTDHQLSRSDSNYERTLVNNLYSLRIDYTVRVRNRRQRDNLLDQVRNLNNVITIRLPRERDRALEMFDRQ